MTHERETAAEAPATRPRARLIDVATAAGVSPKTVSRVINDEAGVLPGTRDRVQRAVRELGFVPDRSARELKRRDADTVGILIDAISDPFFAAFVSVVEELAVAEGLSVIFASTGYDAARESVQLDRLTGHRLVGLIVAPVAVSAATLAGLRTRFPVACIDRERSGIDAVVIDDFGAAVEATTALIAHGHRRVAFMGEDVPYPTVSDRLAGYRSALTAAGLPFDPSLVVTHERFGRGEATEASRLLERDDAPTALLCATSLAAIGTVRAIRSTGLRMPALISFGDFTLAEVLDPGITYVDHDPRLLATAAFRLLRERAVRPEAGPERIVVPTRLVARGSGEMGAPAFERAVSALDPSTGSGAIAGSGARGGSALGPSTGSGAIPGSGARGGSALGPSTGSGANAGSGVRMGSALDPSTGSGAIAGSVPIPATSSETPDASLGRPAPDPLPAFAEPPTVLVATALSLVHPEPAGAAAVPAAAPIGAAS